MRSTRETRVNNGPTVYIEDNRLNKVFSIKNVVSELIAKAGKPFTKGPFRIACGKLLIFHVQKKSLFNNIS